MLAYLRDRVRESPRVTTSLERFMAGEADLLIAGAMVTSDGKPKPVDGLQDHADALAAAKRLDEILSGGLRGFEVDVACAPQTALNLAATAAMMRACRLIP